MQSNLRHPSSSQQSLSSEWTGVRFSEHLSFVLFSTICQTFIKFNLRNVIRIRSLRS